MINTEMDQLDRGLKNIPVVDPDMRLIGVVNAQDALEAPREGVAAEEILPRDCVTCAGRH